MKSDIEVESILSGLSGYVKIGQPYHIRTVTDHWIGRVKAIEPVVDGKHYVVILAEASWIPDTGRFTEFISGKAQPNEVEIVGEIAISMDVICGYIPWNNPIPNKQK